VDADYIAKTNFGTAPQHQSLLNEGFPIKMNGALEQFNRNANSSNNSRESQLRHVANNL